MRTEMTTASLHRRDAGNAGGSAWRAGARGTAWRGGGAAGPLWGDLATPPPAAPRRLREPASSRSADREPRTWARGEGRGMGRGCGAAILKCAIAQQRQKKRLLSAGMRNERGVKLSPFLRCANWAQGWSSDNVVPTLSAPEHCQVPFHPCKFRGQPHAADFFFFFGCNYSSPSCCNCY